VLGYPSSSTAVREEIESLMTPTDAVAACVQRHCAASTRGAVKSDGDVGPLSGCRWAGTRDLVQVNLHTGINTEIAFEAPE